MKSILILVLTALSLQAGQPNILVIMTDDQGYADVGFQNLPASKDVLTPNLNSLARSGTIFTNAYVAASTCSPSRSSILTGRSSSRFGVEENGRHPDGECGPPTSETIIPVFMNKQGYATAAFGKWHLGKKAGMTPLDRGFEYYWGDLPANKDYFMKKLKQPPCWNPPKPLDKTYLTDAITDETIAFIKRKKDQPFFAYVAYNAPHSPFKTTEDLVKRLVAERPHFQKTYERMQKQNKFPNYAMKEFKGEDIDQEILRLVYCSMLLSVDDGLGKIIQTLKDESLYKNTLIFYLSDNGAALARPNDLGGVNLPLRGGKGSNYDGGLKVPFVMSWPGRIPSGQKSDILISAMDIFSTSIELAGGNLPVDRVIDGVNLLPYLTGLKQGKPHDYLFFRRTERNSWALRQGEYKWLFSKEEKSKKIPMSQKLYHIKSEVSEQTDLSAKHPEKAANMKKTFDEATKNLPEPMLRPHIERNSKKKKK